MNEPENLTLRFLRQLDGKLDTVADRLLDLTARLSSLADQFVGFRGELTGLRADFVRLEHRMDRLNTRMQRIEPARSHRSLIVVLHSQRSATGKTVNIVVVTRR
jgi:predicted nuclease with TOPRIM domain